MRVEERDAELGAAEDLLDELPDRGLKRPDAGVVDDDDHVHRRGRRDEGSSTARSLPPSLTVISAAVKSVTGAPSAPVAEI